MAESWTTALPWAPHQLGLARWAAQKWSWEPGAPDWPGALALVAAAEDEGHTALDWNLARALWDRWSAGREPAPAFDLPGPDLWPEGLFRDGWMVRRRDGERDLVQTARNRGLESRLLGRLTALAEGCPFKAAGSTQDDAAARAGKTRFLLLAGGPGTGKTTTLKKLVKAWVQAQPDLRTVVAAPTGRAAARAREAFSGADGTPDCLTLHRLLGLKPGLGRPWHGPDRPLPFDLVIVDEASMVDLRTAVCLVEALAPGAALVLVGDPGQLPSVDPGSVLSDLLGRQEFAGSTVRLTQRFRLAGESRNLARVFDLLQGPDSDPESTADDLKALGSGPEGDFRWIVTADGEDPGPRALEAWGNPGNPTLDDLGRRILLSPVHRGPGGAETLGALVDRSLGRAPGTVEGGMPWMIRRNLPHLGLHNGDRGLVVRQGERLWYTAPGDPEVRWPFSLVAEDGVSAWAVTVHKSQGSEFDRVVLVLPPGESPGLVRELVYTGLTRARQSAVLVGSRETLVRALGRGADRQSGLRD